MVEGLPAITATSPVSPLRNPVDAAFRAHTKHPVDRAAGARRWVDKERPATPVSRSESCDGRPKSSPAWASPVRLIRSRSREPTPANGVQRVQTLAEHDVATPASPMDPLSRHILDRTNTASTIPTHERILGLDGAADRDARSSSERLSAPAVQPHTRRTDALDVAQAHRDIRKGAKAVSFINRLIGNKKRGEGDEEYDDGDDDDGTEEMSTSNDDRPEGNDAQVFVDADEHIGYSRCRSKPPAYIKVRSRFKRQRDFHHLFLAQELDARRERPSAQRSGSNRLRRRTTLEPDVDTVWAMKFSRCGRYLAAGGVDGILRVWAVLASPEDRQKHEAQESGGGGGESAIDELLNCTHLSAPVFQKIPIREYEGHTATILDISWSKNSFLLSSSMDRTVKLWHVTRAECLCTFQHRDFVPSVTFHPRDDRFFLTGALDAKLRLWSIPDKSVAFTALVPEMITAVAFTPDGKTAVAGCLGGLCMFFDTDGMKYQSQIHVRSTRGQNSRGSKITGIQAHYDARGDVKLLITSNDSRVRLYNFRDRNLEMKFRGNQNSCSQIRATTSDDGRYVICGSEDRKAYIWSLGMTDRERRDKRPMEFFEATDTITTAACFAPAKTRALLSRSEDPIYDLCNAAPSGLVNPMNAMNSMNPMTPMNLMERSESRRSSKAATDSGSIRRTPNEAERALDRDRARAPPPVQSPRGWGNHADGNIIVTADFTGKIKVFRQDCAWSKRRQDDWERASTLSKRTGKVSRTGSVTTLASQRERERERERTRSSTSGQSDRIISWRQGIVSTPNVADVHRRLSKNSSRSASPQKPAVEQLQTQRARRAEDAQRDRMAPAVAAAAATASSSPPSQKTPHPLAVDATPSTSSPALSEAARGEQSSKAESPQTPASRPEPDDNPLMIMGGRSFLYYDQGEWKRRADRLRHADAVDIQITDENGLPIDDPDGLAPRPPAGHRRNDSFVSRLSDERSSIDEHFDDAPEDQPHSAQQAICHICRHAIFDLRGTDDRHGKPVCRECVEKGRDKS